MLHLPADKNFIPNFYDSPNSVNYFKTAYINKINSYSHRLINTLKKIVKFLIKN